MIKCFERSTIERIEENSICPAVYLYDTHIIRPWQNRNKKLINRKKKTTLHKDGSSALLIIALEK